MKNGEVYVFVGILLAISLFFFLGADSGEQEVFKHCASKGEFRTMRGDVIKCEIQRSQP